MSEELSLDTRAEVDSTPEKQVRRWFLEIKLAQKRDKDFKKTGAEILDKYRGKNRKKNSFNILWANTEVLRPALYNSTPKPDVRRRFRQNDMLGKAVSEVMERSVSYCVDAYDLDNCLQNDVLDALLPGRGLSRVRYIPKFKSSPAPQMAGTAKPASDVVASTDSSAPAGEAVGATREEVEYEQALCDHVQWDDFLHGPGKTWEEVQWVGFRCRLTRDDQIEKFGEEIAKQITLDDVDDTEISNDRTNTDIKGVFKRSTFWEIWDKEGEKVFFVNDSYKKGVIYPQGENGEPPLNLKNFFPCPRPLQLMEDTGNLVPIALYDLYREQAEELDRVSTRINKVINALKVRGVYDATLSELGDLMKGDDNTLVPAEQARAWMTNGGLEKAIWWMPVEQSAKVLKELYISRDLCKQVIYEITGISDIIRGVTDPNETLGAQQLKANSASLRIQRMQREVQRYTRDLIRLLAEVIGENFDPQTLSQMTGLQFPTNAQKQMIQVQMQAMQQQPGQPPNPQAQQMQQALSMPSWEDIMGVLQSDMQREYRVDVETDSTVAQSLQQDMEGLREVYTALVELWNGAGPAVMSGAVSIEVIKSMSMTLARRARMGLEVEDALESGLQQPKPQEDGKAAAEHAKAQAEQQKIEAKKQADQAKLEHDQQVAQMKQNHDEQVAIREQAMEKQRMEFETFMEREKLAAEERAATQKAMMEDAFARWKAELEATTKKEVAEINADASVEAAAKKAAAKHKPETVA